MDNLTDSTNSPVVTSPEITLVPNNSLLTETPEKGRQLAVGFAFLAIHDYYHCVAGADFSLEGEITAYRTLANQVPSLEIQKILFSEIVLKSSVHIYLSHLPEPKLVFP